MTYYFTGVVIVVVQVIVVGLKVVQLLGNVLVCHHLNVVLKADQVNFSMQGFSLTDLCHHSVLLFVHKSFRNIFDT